MLKEELIKIHIEKLDKKLYKAVQDKWDLVAKPLNGLGDFEKIFDRIGAISGTTDIDIRKKLIISMCADNGVVEEGVSQSGQEVTAIVSGFMAKMQSSVGKMAKVAGSDVWAVDVGINSREKIEGMIDEKVAYGTANFLKQPAMTEEEALAAIEVGIKMVSKAVEAGYKIIGTGEMGIGNTTTSSALTAILTGARVSEVTGRGAGLDDTGLVRKREVICQAIEKYGFEEGKIYSGADDAFKALCCVGGLDIAGLVGVFIGGGIYHVPIVIDGVISAVSALVASEIIPNVKEYMIASHSSREPAAQEIMVRLGITPVINAGLALGEGTGAVMMFGLLDMAFSLYNSQTTFDEMQIDQYERYE